MDKNFLKQQTSNQKGQAIFELIIFLPFLIFLYSIFYTAGNSISGSINQQKAVRGYFYALTKGNSYINTQSDLLALNEKSLKSIGFSAVGWREKSSGQGDNGFAPCFEFTSVLKNGSNEGCDDKTRDEEGKSKIIRVFTFYGVCGPVYGDFSDTPSKFFEIKPELQNNPALCSLDTSPPS